MRCTSHVRNARCLITRRRITVLESQTHDTVGIFILPERMNIYAGSTRWLEPMFPMIPCHDEMARCALQFRHLGSQDEDALAKTLTRKARSDVAEYPLLPCCSFSFSFLASSFFNFPSFPSFRFAFSRSFARIFVHTRSRINSRGNHARETIFPMDPTSPFFLCLHSRSFCFYVHSN